MESVSGRHILGDYSIYGQDEAAPPTPPGIHGKGNFNGSPNWVIALLFVSFGFISFFWDIIIGFMSWINSRISGRKAKWLGALILPVSTKLMAPIRRFTSTVANRLTSLRNHCRV